MRGAFHSEHWHRVAQLRPLLRAHVAVTRQRSRGQAWYIVQDLATGRLHRFTPPVYLVVGSMNGQRSVEEIWRAAVERLGDEAPSQSEIVDILSELHAADLIRSDMDADAAELFQRHTSEARRRLRSRFANPLALRLPLVNPDRFLANTSGMLRPFFGWFGLLLWLAVVGYALMLAAIHWQPLTHNFADRVLGTENVLIMALLFPVLKLLHELGHGYACRLNGGAVPEAGLMLLILAPVPYVDASSSAGFRQRRKRILVAAAGMLVETFLAGLAMIVWTQVEPGLIRTIAFNVMLISGISTLLFNINPLMRLDGYFILCDLIDIPNLGQRATRYWADLAERRLFGLQVEPMATAPGERGWFLFHAPAALVYRTLLMVGIALFVAESYIILGVVLAVFALFGTILWPLFKIVRHVLNAPKLQRVRGRAAAVTFGGAAAFAAAVLLVPLPLRTLTEGVVWLPESAILRVGEDGFVERLQLHTGARVAEGDVILTAAEPDLHNAALVTRSQIEALTLRFDSEWVGERVQSEVTRAELKLKTETLSQQEDRLQRLTLTSGAAGQLVLPHEGDLVGRFLKRGDVVGFVLPDEAPSVRVAVPQADIDLVRGRLAAVEVMLAGRTAERLPARLLREVPAASTRLPSRALSIEGGGRIAVDGRDSRNPRALEGQFIFDLTLPAGVAASAFGARVHVRFDHGLEPLGFQWARRLRQLLLSRLET